MNVLKFRKKSLTRSIIIKTTFTGDIYKKFINQLTEKYRQRLAILGYIPGTFNAEEARAMLGEH